MEVDVVFDLWSRPIVYPIPTKIGRNIRFDYAKWKGG